MTAPRRPADVDDDILTEQDERRSGPDRRSDGDGVPSDDGDRARPVSGSDDAARGDGRRPGGGRSDGRPGDDADAPHQVPPSGWKDILLRVKDEMKTDSVVLLGAGVAFFALIAFVPALIAAVSIYGLVSDPAQIQSQLSDLLSAAPTEVRNLLQQQLTNVAGQTSSGLGLALVIGVAAALWSASSGMKHLMTAINSAYDEEESRGFLKLRGTALLLTVGAIVGLIIAVGTIAILPPVLRSAGLGSTGRIVVSIVRWPILAVLLMGGLSVLYRYAPDRDEPRWSWVAPGTIVAVIGWVIASLLFSFYTSNFSSYGETYGSLGAIVIVMLWLMISAVMVIIGAEINAETEHQTDQDSTTGRQRPAGQRDAVAADTGPEEAGDG